MCIYSIVNWLISWPHLIVDRSSCEPKAWASIIKFNRWMNSILNCMCRLTKLIDRWLRPNLLFFSIKRRDSLWIRPKVGTLIYIIKRYSLVDSMIRHRTGYHRFILNLIAIYLIFLCITLCRSFILRICSTCLSILVENSIFLLSSYLLPHYWGIFKFWGFIFIEDVKHRFKVVRYFCEISLGIADDFLFGLLEG